MVECGKDVANKIDVVWHKCTTLKVESACICVFDWNYKDCYQNNL